MLVPQLYGRVWAFFAPTVPRGIWSYVDLSFTDLSPFNETDNPARCQMKFFQEHLYGSRGHAVRRDVRGMRQQFRHGYDTGRYVLLVPGLSGYANVMTAGRWSKNHTALLEKLWGCRKPWCSAGETLLENWYCAQPAKRQRFLSLRQRWIVPGNPYLEQRKGTSRLYLNIRRDLLVPHRRYDKVRLGSVPWPADTFHHKCC